MPRQPKPWFWKARGAWYVQINGKQVRLHEKKKEADQEFYRLMAAEGRLDGRQKQRMTVADACEALMAQSQHLREGTLKLYERNLGFFAGSQFASYKLHEVSPDEVLRWISGMVFSNGGKGVGDGTASRHLLLRYIKTLYKWARDSGATDINQFARVPNPWKILPRTRPMTIEEYAAIMARPLISPQFKEVVEFVWRTGMRPGEIAKLAARHLDARMRIARFQPTEHKTGTKTGLQREVHFPNDLWERLKKYAELRPTGPLLRKRNGKPWSSRKICDHFNKIKKNMGLTCVLYQARHAYGTNMLESGIPAERVAKMMGQVRPDVLLSTYYHPAAEQMQADVEGFNKGHSEIIDGANAKIEAAREASKEKRREYMRKYIADRRAKEKGKANAEPDSPPSPET